MSSANATIASNLELTSILLWFSYQINESQSLYQTCDAIELSTAMVATIFRISYHSYMHSVDCAKCPIVETRHIPQTLSYAVLCMTTRWTKCEPSVDMSSWYFNRKFVFRNRICDNQTANSPDKSPVVRTGQNGQNALTQRWPNTNCPRRNEHGDNSFESRPNGESDMGPPSWEHDNKG